jgi:hypothetical protein
VRELFPSEFVAFASHEYFLLLLSLFLGRGMDFLSTWIATPNMVLEGNPVAKKLGWRWGIPVNLGICVALALWPTPAIVLTTMSLLVAARNFHDAWLIRSLGEYIYRDWHSARVQETRASLYVLCLLGQTLLTAVVGAAVIWFSYDLLVPTAIGMGIVAYAAAVGFFTLLAVYRMRRALRYRSEDS